MMMGGCKTNREARMAVISMKALLEAGVHFGHRTRRWNPKMKPYIFTERNGIHIIDLQQTLSQLNKAYALVQETVSKGGTLLFVGTKKQAQESVSAESARCEMPFINQRWLGGTLTNWRTIRQRIDQLVDLETRLNQGDFSRLTKKEALEKQRLVLRLQQRLGGLRNMTRLPDLLFITDTRREALAVVEANKLKIPIIALVDTNCDPDPIDLPIPANDDAIRAIKLIVGKMADAVIEGQQLKATLQAEAEEEGQAGPEGGRAEELEDERYLAPGLLAKVRAGVFESQADVVDEDLDVPPADVSA
jgi:small subunit ribosomal protein S2